MKDKSLTHPNTKTAGISCSNFNGIDVVKFICAVLICMLHLQPFSEDKYNIFIHINFLLQNCISRIAVPFFFICSGFFLFRKMSNGHMQDDIIKKYCFGLLRLLGTWYILLFVGGNFHLWYMSATVVAVLILSFLFKHNLKPAHIAVLAVIAYIIGLSGDAYSGIFVPLRQIAVIDYIVKLYLFVFHTTKNGLFMGLIFVFIGAMFACGKIKIKLSLSIAGFTASVILLIAEAHILKFYNIPKDYNMFISVVPAGIFLFAIASQIQLKDSPVYIKLRRAGVLIFFSHVLVHAVVQLVFSAIGRITGINLIPYLFWTTMAIVIPMAFFTEYLSEKEKFKILKWLYS